MILSEIQYLLNNYVWTAAIPPDAYTIKHHC